MRALWLADNLGGCARTDPRLHTTHTPQPNRQPHTRVATANGGNDDKCDGDAEGNGGGT